MKYIVDNYHRDVAYQAGEYVFLKLHPYEHHFLFKRAYQKLASKFYRPYQIEKKRKNKKISPVAYKLKLLPHARLYLIFHVSLLKQKVGESVSPNTNPRPMTEDGAMIMNPQV